MSEKIKPNIEKMPDKFHSRGLDFSLYTYNADTPVYKADYTDNEIDPSVIVTTSTRYPEQLIIGRPTAVMSMHIGMNLLESVTRPYRDFRSIDVIFSSKFDPSIDDWAVKENELPFSEQLLETTGIKADLHTTKFLHPDPRSNIVGIYTDMQRPLMLYRDNTGYIDQISMDFLSAAAVAHEDTHRLLERILHLPRFTKWEETMALTNDVSSFYDLLRKVKNGENVPEIVMKDIEFIIKQRDEIIKAYVNGNFWKGHIDDPKRFGKNPPVKIRKIFPQPYKEGNIYDENLLFKLSEMDPK